MEYDFLNPGFLVLGYPIFRSLETEESPKAMAKTAKSPAFLRPDMRKVVEGIGLVGGGTGPQEAFQ